VPSAGASLWTQDYDLCCFIADPEEPADNPKGASNVTWGAVPFIEYAHELTASGVWCKTTYKFNWITVMFRQRSFIQVLCSWVAAAVFIAVAVVAPGCSTQQNPHTAEAQSQNLPAVGSLEDYLAQGSNDYPYLYASYGPYDPFMFDPFWVAPYWYPVPVYYFHGRGHRHRPLISEARGLLPSHREIYTAAEPAAPNALKGSTHFGGGIRGFGTGQMRGGRR
jgi:hypothetical protein